MAIETLGEAWNLGWRVHMRCAAGKVSGMKRIPECRYLAELDIETLVCTRGRAFPIGLLANRLRCPRCGSRKVTLLYDPPAGAGQARA
jgi:hypothetical protein